MRDFGIGNAIEGLFALVGWLFSALVIIIGLFIVSHMNHGTWTHEVVLMGLIVGALLMLRSYFKRALGD